MKRLILFLMLVAVVQTAAAQNPVEPQPPRPDGSLVHVVQFGDTLDGILSAYARYNVTIENLIVYNGWRFRPQFIFVGDEIVILPPGALDPNTGELIPGFQPPVQPTATTAGEAPAAVTPTPPPAAEVTPVSTPDNLPAAPSVPAFLSIQPFLPVGNAPAGEEIAAVSTLEATPEAFEVTESVQAESTEEVATAEMTPEAFEATESVQAESTEEVATAE
ncbi:MAG: LysM peptidoglycan-binding domain-containing protein, partial [Anaerolineae bacterium]|nr:LysM peptidoglycan-binding domain-containing protein [Anaerolineae bacterium]